MEAVSKTWGFIKRHRRTISIGVGVAAAGWAVWKAKRFLDDYKRMIKELDEARFDQHRLQLHMLRSRSECIPALLNFLHTLKKRVHELVDATWAVKTLKRRRNDPTFSKSEQQELWEQIKVAEFARFFVALYGFNLLNVMLRVQVHILGRYAYESSRAKTLEGAPTTQGLGGGVEEAKEAGPPRQGRDSLAKDDSVKLLSLVYDFFLGPGLKKLAEDVERAVAEEMSVWPVHEKVRVTYGEAHDMLSRIRRRVEGPRASATMTAASASGQTSFPLLDYVIDFKAQPEGGEGKLTDMVNEMWDAVESASFRFAVEDCLDAAFAVFMEDLHRTMYSPQAKKAAAGAAFVSNSSSQDLQETGQNPNQEDRPEDGGASEPPLGKLIPFMKNAAAKIFLDDPDGNQYIRVTADNRSVMLLCSSFFAGDHF